MQYQPFARQRAHAPASALPGNTKRERGPYIMQNITDAHLEDLLAQLQNYPGINISFTSTVRNAWLFSDWARHWMETWRLGQVKDITYEGTYRDPIENHLIPFFGNRYIHEIMPSDIQEFFNLKAQYCALETQKKFRNCLTSIFSTAVESKLCDSSPITSSLRVWSKVPDTVKLAWNQVQYDIAYDFARNHKNGLDIMTLLETAISRSELLGLTWSNFDWKNQCLHLENGLTECRITKTGQWSLMHDGLKNQHRHRTVPISKELTIRLAAKPKAILLEGKRIDTEFIFYSPKGKPYSPKNWYHRVLQVFMRDLNESHPDIPKLTTHELRHTRATLLVYQGVDLYTVARLMGHKDLVMLSKRYLHDDLEAMRKQLGL